MSSDIITAIIAFLGSAIGTFTGIIVNTKLTNYRIEQLEKKQDKHNLVIERVYHLEERFALHDEKLKVVNHRIDELEQKGV